MLNKADDKFTSSSIALYSPAQAASCKVGEKVLLIEGKPPQAGPDPFFADLRYGANGSCMVFTMEDGDVQRVKQAECY
jgi:hypothetical protein